MPNPIDALRSLLPKILTNQSLNLDRFNTAGPFSIGNPTSEDYVEMALSPALKGLTIRPDRPRDVGGLQDYDASFGQNQDASQLYRDDLDRQLQEEAGFRSDYNMSPDDAMIAAYRKFQLPLKR